MSQRPHCLSNAFRNTGTARTGQVAGWALLAGLSLTPWNQAFAQSVAEASGQVEEVIVTGTRIVRDGYEAPTPVTVLQSESLLQLAPASVGDALAKMPAFLNSTSPTATSGVQATAARGTFLNLRGLGPGRTLVLLDGRRVAPTSNTGLVDVGIIPQELIQRVDVVTGGASAVYGSDAVSGVVNFVLDSKFTGLKAVAQGSTSTYGDNSGYRLAVAGGTSFAGDRLHFVGSAERNYTAGIPFRTDRPRADDFWYRGGAGTAASPYFDVANVHYNNLTVGGYAQTGPLAGQQFVAGGVTVPFDPGTPIGAAGRAANGQGVGHSPFCCTLVPPVEKDQFFGRLTYDVSDTITAFAEAAFSLNRFTDKGIIFARQAGQMTIFADNAFLAPATRAALGSTDSFQVNRSFDEWGPNPTKSRTRALNAAFGLQGDIAGKWNWNASYVRGESKFRSSTRTEEYQRFYAAVDAVRDPATGNTVCRIQLTNPGLQPGCVPLNIFGQGSGSQQAIDYVMGNSVWSTLNRMNLFSASISGDAFDLWAGPLTVAAGGEYRKLSLVQRSNSDPSVAWDRTGVNAPTGVARFYQPNVGAVRGSYNVKEAFIEASLPLLTDSPFGESLDLTGALRRTHYSTSGGVTTWKVGTTYAPISDIRLRGAISRDIRAPNLNELFAGQSQVASSLVDTSTGFAGAVLTRSGGNPDLKPERATTYTGGMSVTPSFLPGLVAGVDFFKIKMKDAIAAPFTAQQVLDLCNQSGGSSVLCSQVTRNPALGNIPTVVTLTNQNVSLLSVSGLDFEASYAREVGNGTANVRLLATRLIDYKQMRAPGQPNQQFAGTADLPGFQALPKWTANITVGYELDGWRLNVIERIIGGYKKSTVFVYQENRVPPVAYTDLHTSYNLSLFGKDAQAFLTINNVFNKQGPLFAGTVAPGLDYPVLRGTYDIIGRYFTFGLKVTM